MYPYVYLDGIYLKKNRGGTIENIAVLVALGVNEARNREIIGAAEGGKEDKESWLNFLRLLKERGLKGVRLMVSDKCLGLREAIKEVYPEAAYQRCMVHFMRNILTVVPRTRSKEVAANLKAIFAQEDRPACEAKAADVVRFLRENKMRSAANALESGISEALNYTAFPREHWLKTRKPLMELNGSTVRFVGAPIP